MTVVDGATCCTISQISHDELCSAELLPLTLSCTSEPELALCHLNFPSSYIPVLCIISDIWWLPLRKHGKNLLRISLPSSLKTLSVKNSLIYVSSGLGSCRVIRCLHVPTCITYTYAIQVRMCKHRFGLGVWLASFCYVYVVVARGMLRGIMSWGNVWNLSGHARVRTVAKLFTHTHKHTRAFVTKQYSSALTKRPCCS